MFVHYISRIMRKPAFCTETKAQISCAIYHPAEYYQYFSGSKCDFAQGHNTAEVGIEPSTSRSGVMGLYHYATAHPFLACIVELFIHILESPHGQSCFRRCRGRFSHDMLHFNHDQLFSIGLELSHVLLNLTCL